jgi:hypothetical protein
MLETEPAALHLRLREYFAGHRYDGLFIAFLDHSPTEQLIGEKWHTSALILSAAVEHSALADELAQVANPLTCKLTKWVRANSHYKKRFYDNLMSGLGRHRVMMFAISATEPSIAASEVHFIKDLGGSQCYRRYVRDGRTRVSIGPLVNARTGEKHSVELSGNQAPMVLFIAHFLRRMHQEVQGGLSVDAPMYVTWNFFADKPPNGAEGAFDRALGMLLGLSDPRGALRWGYFLQGDKVETDLLADNVAGLLNEMMRAPERYSGQFGEIAQDAAGLFYWECWTI